MGEVLGIALASERGMREQRLRYLDGEGLIRAWLARSQPDVPGRRYFVTARKAGRAALLDCWPSGGGPSPLVISQERRSLGAGIMIPGKGVPGCDTLGLLNLAHEFAMNYSE